MFAALHKWILISATLSLAVAGISCTAANAEHEKESRPTSAHETLAEGVEKIPLEILSVTALRTEEVLDWGGQRIFVSLHANRPGFLRKVEMQEDFSGVFLGRESAPEVYTYQHLAILNEEIFGAPTIEKLRKGNDLEVLATLTDDGFIQPNENWQWQAEMIKTEIPWLARVLSGGLLGNGESTILSLLPAP